MTSSAQMVATFPEFFSLVSKEGSHNCQMMGFLIRYEYTHTYIYKPGFGDLKWVRANHNSGSKWGHYTPVSISVFEMGTFKTDV